MNNHPANIEQSPPAHDSGSGRLILIVEDEEKIVKFLQMTLDSRGYKTAVAWGVRAAVALATSRPPDLILLDLGLPDGDGVSFIRSIRAWSSVPIIIISAREREIDKITALDAGADDYITKPFATGELLARIRGSLRRADGGQGEKADPIITIGALSVDLASHTAMVGGGAIHLTPTEFKLVSLLVKHRGKLLTHEQLLRDVWGLAHQKDTQYLRVFMGNIRKKLGDDPTNPKYIITEPGVGYRFVCE